MFGKLFATATALALAGSAYAAQINVYPVYSHTYDASFNDLGVMDLGSAASRDPSLYHTFDLYFTVSGQASNASFQSLLTNIVLGPGLVIAGDYDSSTASPATWSNASPARSGNIFSTNADIGQGGTHDLQAINAVADVNAAYYANPGESAPQKFGSIYLSFAPGFTGGSTVTTTSINGDSWSMWINLTRSAGPSFTVSGGQEGESAGFVPGTFAIPSVPEPASLSLLGLGVLGLAARRRQA